MRYAITIAALILTIGVLAGLKGAQIAKLIGFGQEMQKLGPPPESVNSARAEEQDWEQTRSAIASVVSTQGVALSNDVPGMVTKLWFDSGARVRAGQPLVELDTSVELAQIESLRARLDLAGQSLDRTRPLVASGVSTQAELDAEESSFKGISADVKALQAQIARKTVRAPFSGQLGIRTVNVGQYLAPGTPVTVIESTGAVFVDFTLPQHDLSSVQLGQRVRVRAEPTEPPLAEGTISAFDTSVDAVTRSIKIRASMPNAESKLRTGMFVVAEVLLPDIAKVVVVPVTAVVHAAYGDSVFVVEAQKSAEGAPTTAPAGPPAQIARQQFVRLGTTRGDFVAILEGISTGQEVVTGGSFKLRNGGKVAVNNEVVIESKRDPRPKNR